MLNIEVITVDMNETSLDETQTKWVESLLETAVCLKALVYAGVSSLAIPD